MIEGGLETASPLSVSALATPVPPRACDAHADVFGPFDRFPPFMRSVDPAFRALLSHLRDGRIWAKLTVCRASRAKPDYPDARPLHDALVAANPDRLLWGSDWPYVRMGDLMPDAGRLLDLFQAWVGDAGLARRILVDKPAALYGFTGSKGRKEGRC
jgi:predicted TIM-barrel fold metal-dependent hydrolase